jgi:hypothetical protein
MLDNEIVRKIEAFVYSKPRSIQEIALHTGKNWRTADRYVDEIEKNFGTLSTRVFRGGTRGALKIVFWSSIEKINSSAFQERLEQQITHAIRKEDFSAFDLYQHVDDKYKKAIIEKKNLKDDYDGNDLMDIISHTKKQLIIFSGNLSFINMKSKKMTMIKVLDTLVKKGVTMKIICRVDLVGKQNVEKILELNFKNGKESIEIRHQEQPIRAFIIDNEIIRIKEIKEPTGKINELNKKIVIYYEIRDREWCAWLAKIFWKMFSNSIDSGVRIRELNKLK